MSKKNIKFEEFIETLTIFRRSLIFQTKEFFQNSTLHGVRYIAETGRPIGEKFMWFCFTSIGTITALVIIMSLWEKFQTNPTITGLDTDFHNQNVVFPTTVICPEIMFSQEQSYDVAYRELSNNDENTALLIQPFLEKLPSLSFKNLKEGIELVKDIPLERLNTQSLRHWAFKVNVSCEDVISFCKYRDEVINCCAYFDPIYTEHGFCFAFNSRFKSLPNDDQKSGPAHDLYETDKKWALFFVPNGTAEIFIFSNQEYFGKDYNAQIEWSDGETAEVRISKKNTYTTDDARQLTIGQRKCIFFDEVKLQYFPDEYTFSSCMKECRIKKALKLCKCNPHFYKPLPNVPMCTIADFECLDKFKNNITTIKDCVQCELSCSKTVFNIEKLSKTREETKQHGVLVEFLTWPIIRYKREVLFGWVDLLVSFGGIASLFLGFSLLSGVEIIYYFTLRACCMVYKNREELEEIEEKIKLQPPPPIDLTFKIRRRSNMRVQLNDIKSDDDSIMRNNLNNTNKSNDKAIHLDKHNKLKLNVSSHREHKKKEKGYISYAKSLFKAPKIIPQYADEKSWQYGQYLP